MLLAINLQQENIIFSPTKIFIENYKKEILALKIHLKIFE
jgi:hypothetical protein